MRAATAQARFTGLLVVLLPLGGALLAELASPGYLRGLAGSFLTLWLAGLALALQVVAARPHQTARARGDMTGLLAFASAVLAVAGLGLLAARAAQRPRLGGRSALAARLGGRLRPSGCPAGELAGADRRRRRARPGSACAT